MPSVETGIVDPQRGAVKDARQDPDVLDGAAFEHPAEMNFAPAALLGAVVLMNDGIHLPVADQPAVKTHLVGAVGRRAAGMERVDKGCGHVSDSRGSRLNDVDFRRTQRIGVAWEKLLKWLPRN